MSKPTHTMDFHGDDDRQNLINVLKFAIENPALKMDGKSVAMQFVQRIAKAAPVDEKADEG